MYCVLYISDFYTNGLRCVSDYFFTTWKTAVVTGLPKEIVVRRDIFILRDSIYITYDNYRKGNFNIGKFVSGDGNWSTFGGRTKYLEIMPVTLFFTEIL